MGSGIAANDDTVGTYGTMDRKLPAGICDAVLHFLWRQPQRAMFVKNIVDEFIR
jgi:hypothetical protein